MPNNRLNFYIRHLSHNLRGGFLIRPLMIALVFGLLGAFLSATESQFEYVGTNLSLSI